MAKKEAEIKVNALHFFKNFEDSFVKSDKKTAKDNMMPFFAVSEEIK
jgi:hypothetical protein